MLETLIRSKGLDRHLLRQDMFAAINRTHIHGDIGELSQLTRDQLLMYLIVEDSAPGDPLWLRVEQLLGETLAQ